jgi:hypothetical protein
VLGKYNYQFQILLNTLNHSLIAHPSSTATYTKASTPSFSFGSYWLNVRVSTTLGMCNSRHRDKEIFFDVLNYGSDRSGGYEDAR